LVQGPDFGVVVRRGCDPLEPIVLFGAAVLAFPAPIPKKLWGLAAGSSILFVVNLIRVASLYVAGRTHTVWFETIHQELWPAFFIVFAVVLWCLWLWWAQPSAVRHQIRLARQLGPVNGRGILKREA
jgi:exosortase/archaeosortase family protein